MAINRSTTSQPFETKGPGRSFGKIRAYLERNTDGRPFILFRTLWSLILLILPLRYFLNGWIERYFYEPEFFFSFLDFAWYGPLPAPGMYILFGALCTLAICIGLGWRYRWAAGVYSVLFAYFLSIDKTIYLNHYYLVFLLTALLAALPAPYASKSSPENPGSAPYNLVVPRISELSIKFLIALVYLYAALAKVRYDWLVEALPLRIWLPARADSFPAGDLLTYPALAWVFAWGGLIFDGTIAFFLFARRTAPYAFLAVVGFHVATALLFRIGMFPWIMIAANTIFLPPLRPIVDGRIGKRAFQFLSGAAFATRKNLSHYSATGASLFVLLAFFAFQLFFPARRFLYPGNTIWNEHGFRFSWQVMVMQKSGICEFTVDSGNHRFLVHPSEILTPYQELMMSTQPDMILQFGRHLANRYEQNGPTRVFANCLVSLNGRRHQPLIRDDVDLANPRTSESEIIVPLR